MDDPTRPQTNPSPEFHEKHALVMMEMEETMWKRYAWHAFPIWGFQRFGLVERVCRTRETLSRSECEAVVALMRTTHLDAVLDLAYEYGIEILLTILPYLVYKDEPSAAQSMTEIAQTVRRNYDWEGARIVGAPPTHLRDDALRAYRIDGHYTKVRNGVEVAMRITQPSFARPPKYLKKGLKRLGVPISALAIVPNIAHGGRNYCLGNANAMMNANGGKIALGYALCEAPHHFELVGHAIWEAPNGQLIDPTPISDCTKTYFVSLRTTTDPDHPSIRDLFCTKLVVWKPTES